MAGIVQLSIIDHADLIGGAVYGVELSASDIASDFGLLTERSFDDRDYFDVFCLEYKGVRMAFQHRFRQIGGGSMVSFGNLGKQNPVRLIAEVCNIDPEEVLIFDGAQYRTGT